MSAVRTRAAPTTSGAISTIDPAAEPWAATGIDIQGLSKEFALGRKTVTALADTNLGTRQNSFLSLLGPVRLRQSPRCCGFSPAWRPRPRAAR